MTQPTASGVSDGKCAGGVVPPFEGPCPRCGVMSDENCPFEAALSAQGGDDVLVPRRTLVFARNVVAMQIGLGVGKASETATKCANELSGLIGDANPSLAAAPPQPIPTPEEALWKILAALETEQPTKRGWYYAMPWLFVESRDTNPWPHYVGEGGDGSLWSERMPLSYFCWYGPVPSVQSAALSRAFEK